MNAEPASFPLQAASLEKLARIRAALVSAGFDEETLCRELKIPSMAELGKSPWVNLSSAERPERLRAWAGVFLYGERGARAALEGAFGPELVLEMMETGLLRPVPSQPDRMICPVFLYPVDGFLVASDRHDDPERPGVSRDAQADVVFPGIFGGTLRFLELLPSGKGGDALDLCGGSGIGALRFASTARVAVSSDVTARATCFASFNARLNGCLNVEAVCGDLYEAVGHRQFDVITAHPPYVPSLGNRMIYRDAGDAGEDITRRIVAGLPGHLRPGGRALILCQGRDAEDGPFEQRVRAWLGDAQSEFDLLFALQATKTVEQEAAEMARRVNPPTREELAELVSRFRNLGTRQFVYGALAFSRHSPGDARAGTCRTRLSPETRYPDFERWFAWHRRRTQPGFEQWLAQCPLRLSPHTELRIRHIVQDGALVPAEFVFEIDQPFPGALRVDGWVTPLVARFDGVTTSAKIHAAGRAADELPAGFELAHFLDLVAKMVERGYLQVAD